MTRRRRSDHSSNRVSASGARGARALIIRRNELEHIWCVDLIKMPFGRARARAHMCRAKGIEIQHDRITCHPNKSQSKQFLRGPVRKWCALLIAMALWSPFVARFMCLTWLLRFGRMVLRRVLLLGVLLFCPHIFALWMDWIYILARLLADDRGFKIFTSARARGHKKKESARAREKEEHRTSNWAEEFQWII